MTEDEMVGWHHRFNRHEFEQTLGNSEGQGSFACCSPRGCKALDMTQQQQHEESEAEEVIAGVIFSRLITEVMFEQGPP